MALISLVYRVQNPPNISATQLAAAVGAILLFQGELDMLAFDVFSDVTFPSATEAIRFVTLITNAESDALWPTDESKIYATRNLYRQRIAQKLPGQVSADLPVVI